MWNKFFAVLSVLGLLFIGIVIGNVFSYYKIPPSKLVSEAILWAESWHSIQKSAKRVRRLHREIAQKGSIKPIVRWNEQEAFNGYTLISRKYSDNVWLIDMQGKIVHQWHVPFRKAWPNLSHITNKNAPDFYMHKVHALLNGDILVQYTAIASTPYGAGIAKYDKNSNLLWKYTENAHHDFYVDKTNGDIYGLVHKIIKERPPEVKKLSFPLLVDYIVRLDKNGNELKRISLLEAFNKTKYFPMILSGTKTKLWDQFHTNSVMKLEPGTAGNFPLFEAGQVLLSVRNPSTIAVVDLNEEKVIWAKKGIWKMQHEAKFLPDGTISLFDNQGYSRKRGVSRALIISPHTNKIVWEYNGAGSKRFHSKFMGKVQVLPNGNTLITSTHQRNVFEVTKNGEVVWDYKYNAHSQSYLLTAHRYSKEELPFLSEQP